MQLEHLSIALTILDLELDASKELTVDLIALIVTVIRDSADIQRMDI